MTDEESVLDAVIVIVPLSDPDLGSVDDYTAISVLEERLIAAVADAEVGEFDGHEFGNGECRIMFYGASVEQLESVIIPIVKASSSYPNAYVTRIENSDPV